MGKAGPKSNARFQSQHYNPRSAQSTLAGALMKSRILWSYLGSAELTAAEVGNWIRRNTDRDNFYLTSADEPALAVRAMC